MVCRKLLFSLNRIFWVSMPEMCPGPLNLKAKMTRTGPGRPWALLEPFGVHSRGTFPRVSIHFVCYLRHSRRNPFILYVIYVIPAGIHLLCTLFTSFPRVSFHFARHLHHSRGYPFILDAINVMPAGIHSFCTLLTPFPRVSINFVCYLRHPRGYPFILYAIHVIPAGIRRGAGVCFLPPLCVQSISKFQVLEPSQKCVPGG